MPIPFPTLLMYDSFQCDVCLVFNVCMCMCVCVYICVYTFAISLSLCFDHTGERSHPCEARI